MPVTTSVEDLQRPGALELLHSPDPARLAYTGPDGYPRVIPIGFLWNGTAVVVCTAPTAPKVAALAKQPHVALTIDIMGPPAKELLLRGTASIEIVDGVGPRVPRRRRPSPRMATSLPRSRPRCEACIRRWPALQSFPRGRASMTSARVACPRFCAGSCSLVPPDGFRLSGAP